MGVSKTGKINFELGNFCSYGHYDTAIKHGEKGVGRPYRAAAEVIKGVFRRWARIIM